MGSAKREGVKNVGDAGDDDEEGKGKEMEEKGNSQARKAWEKCVRTETPYGPRYTYPGYRPLLEYVVVTTA